MADNLLWQRILSREVGETIVIVVPDSGSIELKIEGISGDSASIGVLAQRGVAKLLGQPSEPLAPQGEQRAVGGDTVRHVVARLVEQTIQLGKIEVKVVEVHRSVVKLRVIAPADVKIVGGGWCGSFEAPCQSPSDTSSTGDTGGTRWSSRFDA